MHKLQFPSYVSFGELCSWARENCHGGHYVVSAPPLPALITLQTMINLLDARYVGPTLVVKNEIELVHAKLRFW